MKKAFYSLLLVFLIIAFPVMISKTNAQTTAVFVDPASIQNQALTVGKTFIVNVKVADVTNLFTWQILVKFNSTLLSCENATYPSAGYIFVGLNQIPVSPVIDNTAGTVTFGATLLTQVASGSGGLCVIAFKVLAVGHSALAFSTPYGGDTFLLDDVLNVIPATVTNGFFSNEAAPPAERHDVAVTGISLSPNPVFQGNETTITVHVLNNGTFVETFDVQVSNDSTIIETQTVASLGTGLDKTLTFIWNTSEASVGKHTITAKVLLTTDEDSTNNAKSATITVMSATGPNTDVNGDGHVDMKDVGIVAAAFGTYPGHPRWNPVADLNNDGFVNLFDIAAVVRDFWKK
jgi:hypothetical protein